MVQGFAVIKSSNGQLLSVSKINQHDTTYTQAQLKSDLRNYVVHRLSYAARNKTDIALWQRYMNWHSSDKVYHAFVVSQQSKKSLMNTLGFSGTAYATVSSISFVGGNEDKPTNALVDVTQTVINGTGEVSTHSLRLTLAWQYTGTPQDEVIALNNWSGFEVTHYDISSL